MGELGNDRFMRSDDLGNYSKLYEGEGNLRWIWRKGVSLGKKMVVTGVVVSSAPFVLPPLVALSAIGFAFSLPAGFVFATYACTDKLMNALLPIPSCPPYLESEAVSSDEEENRVDDDSEVDKGYEEDDDIGLQENDIGAQEKEFEEDARNEFENRIELGEEDDRDIRDGNCVMHVNEDEQGALMSLTEIVEESGYEEDVGEYMDAEEQILDSTTFPDTMEEIQETDDNRSLIGREVVKNPEDYLGESVVAAESGGIKEKNAEQAAEQFLGSNTILDTMEGIRETDDDISLIERGVVKNPEDNLGESVVAAELGRIKEKIAEQAEEQGLYSTTSPDIMEGIRETDNGLSLIEREVAENPEDFLGEFVVEAELGGIKENKAEQVAEELAFVPPIDVREENWNNDDLADIDENELKNETTRLLEQIRFEGRDDHGWQDSTEEGMCLENDQNEEIETKDMTQERGGRDLSAIPEEVLVGIVGSDEVREAVNERSEKNKTEIVQEQTELVIERMLVVNVEMSVDHTDTDIHQGTGSDERIETLIVSDVVAVETADESRFDDKTEVAHKLADLLTKGEDLASQSGDIDVNFDYHEIRGESTPMSNQTETRLDQESTANSDKELLSEEKIWDQIHSIRTVVGYKTAPNASCMEELKALYGFTGVELPVSSKDAGDLADINEKLHLLMSIVGVK